MCKRFLKKGKEGKYDKEIIQFFISFFIMFYKSAFVE